MTAGRRVEGARRLVAEEDGRPGDQGTGQGHPLLLAAGELRRAMPRALGETHAAQRLAHLRARGASTGEPQGECHVLRGSERRQQVEGLEHETDPVPAQECERPFAESGEVGPGDGDGARRRTVQARGALEQRRLPGPGGPHHGGEGPGEEVEVDPVESGDAAVLATYGGEPHSRCGHASTQPPRRPANTTTGGRPGGMASPTVPRD